MILGITGSRYFEKEIFNPDLEYIKNRLKLDFSKIEKVVSGGAVGFDQTFENYIITNYPKIELEIIKPDYSLPNKKMAPILRNKTIVEKSDFILAIVSNLESKGTQSTIKFAKELNKNFRLYLYEYQGPDLKLLEKPLWELL